MYYLQVPRQERRVQVHHDKGATSFSQQKGSETAEQEPEAVTALVSAGPRSEGSPAFRIPGRGIYRHPHPPGAGTENAAERSDDCCLWQCRAGQILKPPSALPEMWSLHLWLGLTGARRGKHKTNYRAARQPGSQGVLTVQTMSAGGRNHFYNTG